jgi:hypothetical protein
MISAETEMPVGFLVLTWVGFSIDEIDIGFSLREPLGQIGEPFRSCCPRPPLDPLASLPRPPRILHSAPFKSFDLPPPPPPWPFGRCRFYYLPALRVGETNCNIDWGGGGGWMVGLDFGRLVYICVFVATCLIFVWHAWDYF